MELIYKEEERYIVRLDKGEEFLESIKVFCKRNGINSGWLNAVGAVNQLEIGMYNLDTKKYEGTKFEEDLEIANITGNISKHNDRFQIHAHGTFAGADHKAIAGHIKKATVSVTCEVFIIAFKGSVQRKMDADIGLPLFSR